MGYQTNVLVLHEFDNLDFSEICHPNLCPEAIASVDVQLG